MSAAGALRSLGGPVGRPVAAVGVALVVGAALIASSGHDPGEAYGQLWDGAVGNVDNLAGSLRIGTTLLFTSLAFTFAFRSGIFNAGPQGQFLIGGFAAAWVGFTLTDLPGPLIVLLAFVAGALGGGLWAAGPAVLLVRWRVNEIVTSLMLTSVAALLAKYLVVAKFSATGGQVVATPDIAQSARLHEFVKGSGFTWAMLLGLGLVALYGVFLHRTVLGYEMRMMGASATFARYGGIATTRVTLIAMIGSGMIAGLGGAQQILGVDHRYLSDFTVDVGLAGIIASLLGQNRPLGLTIACFFLGGLQNGALNMELFTDVHRSAISVVSALIILLATATPQMLRRRGRANVAAAQLDVSPPPVTLASEAHAAHPVGSSEGERT